MALPSATGQTEHGNPHARPFSHFNAENAVGCRNVFLMLAMGTSLSRSRLVLSGIGLERSVGSAFRRFLAAKPM
jgi:hypothetical protein